MALFPNASVPPPENATEYAQPLDLPELDLLSHREMRFGRPDLVGRFTLMFFGFTHCPDICPLSLQVLAAAVDSIRTGQPGAEPQVVLISVDPDRDSPARLADYLANFDSEFIGATASNGGLEPLLRRFGVTVMRQALGGANYSMTHNPQVFVIGPEAQLIAIISNAEDPELVVRDYLRIRSRYLSGRSGEPATR